MDELYTNLKFKIFKEQREWVTLTNYIRALQIYAIFPLLSPPPPFLSFTATYVAHPFILRSSIKYKFDLFFEYILIVIICRM